MRKTVIFIERNRQNSLKENTYGNQYRKQIQ